MGIAVPVIMIGVTGLVCGAILAVAAKFFSVQEDPRVEKLLAALPGVNCGGCGFPGCAEYAKEMALRGVDVNLCKAGGDELVTKLSALLGVTATKRERQVAIVLCQAGDDKAARKALYNGVADCRAAELAGGGGKACRYGCMGYGTCARVCPVGAIEILATHLAVVHPDLCIACGKCVKACPRKLIKLIPENRFLHVLCSSRDKGPAVKKVCSVGCIGCTLCFKAVEGKGIRMEGPLAIVDYATPLENEAIIAKCPQHTIVKRPGQKGAA